jgi:hypothetical protein
MAKKKKRRRGGRKQGEYLSPSPRCWLNVLCLCRAMCDEDSGGMAEGEG